MRNAKLLLSAVVLSAMTQAASAAVSVPYGWYVEANAGQSHSTALNLPGSVKNTGFGASGNLGYKFSTWVAAEVGYTHYANTRVSVPGSAQVARIQDYSYDVAGKLMLPIGGTGIEVFGKLGVGRMHSNLTVTNTALASTAGYTFNSGTHSINGAYFGAGADYAIMPNLLVNGAWARQKGDTQTGNNDLYSVGLAYIF